MRRLFLTLTLLLASFAAADAQTRTAAGESSIVLDLEDGYTATNSFGIDPEGYRVKFLDVKFPKYVLDDETDWTLGVRTSLVKLFGCEAFKDCSPTLAVYSYSSEDLLVTGARLPERSHVLAFRLVNPETRKTVGASFLVFDNE